MGWAAAIGAIATLLTTILVWIQKGTAKSPTQNVENDKQAIDDEIKKTEETGRPQ